MVYHDDNVIPNDVLDIFKGVLPPKRIWQLKDLQVLSFIKVTDEMVQILGSLNELTQLAISEIRSAQCENLFTTIS